MRRIGSRRGAKGQRRGKGEGIGRRRRRRTTKKGRKAKRDEVRRGGIIRGVAVLFGVWHIGYMVPQIVAGNWFAVWTKAAVGLVYGFILGFVRLRTGNCYSTMLAHGVMNLFAF